MNSNSYATAPYGKLDDRAAQWFDLALATLSEKEELRMVKTDMSVLHVLFSRMEAHGSNYGIPYASLSQAALKKLRGMDRKTAKRSLDRLTQYGLIVVLDRNEGRRIGTFYAPSYLAPEPCAEPSDGGSKSGLCPQSKGGVSRGYAACAPTDEGGLSRPDGGNISRDRGNISDEGGNIFQQVASDLRKQNSFTVSTPLQNSLHGKAFSKKGKGEGQEVPTFERYCQLTKALSKKERELTESEQRELLAAPSDYWKRYTEEVAQSA